MSLEASSNGRQCHSNQSNMKNRIIITMLVALFGMQGTVFAQPLPAKYTIGSYYDKYLGIYVKEPSFMEAEPHPATCNFRDYTYKDVSLSVSVLPGGPVTRFFDSFPNGVNMTKINNNAYVFSGYISNHGKATDTYYYTKIQNVRGLCYKYELRCNRSRVKYIGNLKKLVYYYNPFKK